MGCCGRGRVKPLPPAPLEMSGTDEGGDWILVIDSIDGLRFCPECKGQAFKSKHYDRGMRETFVRVFCPRKCNWSVSTKPRKVYLKDIKPA